MRQMLAALAAVLAMPLAAHASPTMTAAVTDSSPYYVGTRVGMYVPQSDDMDAFDNGLNTEVQVGRRFNQNFALELGLGWMSSSADTGAGEISVSSIPLTATAKGILPFGKAELYGLGGLGAYFSDFKVETPNGDVSDDDTSLGLHLGVGAQFALTQQLSLGVESRYMFAEAFDADIDGFLLNGALAFRF